MRVFDTSTTNINHIGHISLSLFTIILSQTFSSSRSEPFPQHDTLNSGRPIKFKGLTQFYKYFLTKIFNLVHPNILNRTLFSYKFVILVSIYLLKLKIKLSVLIQNRQDTFHNLNILVLYQRSTAKIFLKNNAIQVSVVITSWFSIMKAIPNLII